MAALSPVIPDLRALSSSKVPPISPTAVASLILALSAWILATLSL
jgi:hypothetical protein